jgi:chaperonin GroEL (HSP60 family)
VRRPLAFAERIDAKKYNEFAKNTMTARSAEDHSRCALQDAASVAGLLLTTDAMAAEAPKKASDAPAMPPGGMDY